MKKILLMIFSLFFSLVYSQETLPVVVLGGGIGGLTSSIYLARSGMETTVFEGEMLGGSIALSSQVENWPGEDKIAGKDLVLKVRHQALENGVKIFPYKVTGVDFSTKPFLIRAVDLTDPKTEKTFYCQSVIIAMGTKINRLFVEGEREYFGKGISACAVCDGALYKEKNVAVIGGGNSALSEAFYLSSLAKKVYVIFRKDHLKEGVDEKLKTSLLSLKNVEFVSETKVEKFLGEKDSLDHLVLKNVKNEQEQLLSVDGAFLALGSTPNTEIFSGRLALDKDGYILLTDGQKTSVDGVYAIGDIVNPVYKQAIIASGEGARAAIQLQRYFEEHPLPVAVKIQGKEQEAKSFVREIKKDGQMQEMLKREKRICLVDVYATWCPPCKMLAPQFEKMAQKYHDKVSFFKMDVESCPVDAKKYQVKSLPTLLVFDANGKQIDKKMGLDQISEYLKTLSSEK